jgi:cyclophilin family peptidyl-prolyl cis-trans isomerase
MNSKVVLAIILLILTLGVGIGISKITGHASMTDSNKIKIETNYGNIVAELYPDKAPITVENFKTYVQENFYDNTTFHRIINGFMIQGGGFDAETGEQKETHEPIKLESNNGLKNDRGTLAMARTSNPNSATSQFFINTENNDFLNYGVRDEGYAVFGKVTEGMDVVDKISKVQTDTSNKPLKEVIITKIEFIK